MIKLNLNATKGRTLDPPLPNLNARRLAHLMQ
jgi:hypothetical protein